MIDSSTAPQLYICLYLYVPPNYACVCIDTFVYFIQYILCLNSFVLSLSGVWVITPPSCCYICVLINMFVSIISMFTAICLCTL